MAASPGKLRTLVSPNHCSGERVTIHSTVCLLQTLPTYLYVRNYTQRRDLLNQHAARAAAADDNHILVLSTRCNRELARYGAFPHSNSGPMPPFHYG